MVKFELDKLDELLENLKELPRVKEITALRKRLQKEKEKLAPEAAAPAPTPAEVTVKANASRSSKLSRYWRYVKLIRDNFPNLKTNEIRNQLKQRQQGQEVDIPDAVWQNPSP